MSWAEQRQICARSIPGKPVVLDCQDCHVIGYNRAKDVFGPGVPEGYVTTHEHAGYIKRCPVHDVHPPPRTWIRDISLYKFKRFMQQGLAFPYDALRALLPTNHPEFRGTR